MEAYNLIGINMKINLLHNPIVKYIGAFVGSFMIGILAGKLAMPISGAYAVNEIVVNEDNTATASKTTTEKSLIEEAAVSDIASADIYDASANKNTSYAISYNSSANTAVSYAFSIPALGIYSPLTQSSMNNKKLDVPASNVGVYGTLYMGHTPGVFSNLAYAKAGQQVIVNGVSYIITSVNVYEIDPDGDSFNNDSLKMKYLVNLPAGQIALMTCTNGSSTHRTIVFAQAQ